MKIPYKYSNTSPITIPDSLLNNNLLWMLKNKVLNGLIKLNFYNMILKESNVYSIK